MKILVTGCAGFIGAHLTRRLLDNGFEVIGVDNLNDYYDASLKEARLALFSDSPLFTFHKVDIADKAALATIFASQKITHVVNLAAQAGVRYSLENPDVYVQANIVGFFNILELSRQHDILHVVFSSSSSVYGANTQQPFSESDHTDHPIALYAATKKANELMAHSYASAHQLPCTGLRFFTVYGPWGRPDMALFKFTHSILHDLPIDIYNHGEMARDFTYVDDIIDSIYCVLQRPASPSELWSSDAPNAALSPAPYRLYNVGRGQSVKLLDFIEALESALGKHAVKNFMPLQKGDLVETRADVSLLEAAIGQRPSTSIETGILQFVTWYQSYYE